MNTHDIDLASEIWAAAQRGPGEGIEDAIERIVLIVEADRKRRGEPVGEIQCRIYHATEQYRDYLRARFRPGTWGNRVSFEWQGHRWAYRHTHFDDSGEYDLIARPSPQPAEPPQTPGTNILRSRSP